MTVPAVANAFRSCRQEAGVPMALLAQEFGISFSLLGSIERGETNPTLNVLWLACARFRLGADVFCTYARLLDDDNENRLDLRGLPEDVRSAVIILLAERL